MEREPADNVYEQERQRAWQQRWATPGNDPFEQWYWKLCRYFNRKVDPEIMEIYRKMLGSIPVPELEAVFEQYIMQPDIPSREPPKVNVLYAMWKDRKGKQTEKRRARDAKSGQTDALDERDELRDRMNAILCFTILGEQKIAGLGNRSELETPEWMQTIADWVVQQMHNDHPGKKPHELPLAKYFDMGRELFDQERPAYETTEGD